MGAIGMLCTAATVIKTFVELAGPLAADACIFTAVAPGTVLCDGAAGRETPLEEPEFGCGSESFGTIVVVAIVIAAFKSCGGPPVGTVFTK